MKKNKKTYTGARLHFACINIIKTLKKRLENTAQLVYLSTNSQSHSILTTQRQVSTVHLCLDKKTPAAINEGLVAFKGSGHEGITITS